MKILKVIIVSCLLFALLSHEFLSAAGSMWSSGSIVEIIHIEKAYAQAPVLKGGSAISDMAQRFFGGVLQVFVVLNWITLSADQALLDPDVIFGNKLKGGGRPMELILKNIWVASRNIVNTIFAFVVLVAGIYLIIRSDGEGWSKIKSTAPKFVIAVILVNFSWFFPRVILDISNILTASVYQLPSLVNPAVPCIGGPDDEPCVFVWKVRFFPTMGECKATTPPPECKRPTGNTDTTPFGERGQRFGDFVDVFYEDWGVVHSEGKYYPEIGPEVPVSGADLILNGLAVNFAKLPSFAIIDFKEAKLAFETKDTLEVFMSAAKFFISLVMHVIFSVAIGLAMLALMVVLIVRIGVLWLCIGFMPFIFLGFAMGGQLGDLKAEGAPNIWKIFLSYAFLPALVAVPFAIGFTLMSNLYYVKAMSVAMRIEGFDFIPGIESFHELIWMIMAIGILWMGVFSVLSKDKVAGGMVNGIKGIGTTGLNVAKNLALSTPIAGLPGGSMVGAYDRYKALPGQIRMRGHMTPLTPSSKPMQKETIEKTAAMMNPTQFNELLKALQDHSRDNPNRALEEMAKIIHVSTNKTTSIDDAKRMLMDKDSFNTFIQSSGNKLTGNQKTEMMRLAETFQNVTNVSNVITLPNAGFDRNTMVQKIQNAIQNTPNITLQKIRENLKAHHDSALVGGDKQILNDLLTQANNANDLDAFKQALTQNPPPTNP